MNECTILLIYPLKRALVERGARLFVQMYMNLTRLHQWHSLHPSLSLNYLDVADILRATQAVGKTSRFHQLDPCGVNPRTKITLILLQ